MDLRSNVDLKGKWRNMSVMENGWGSRERARLALKRMHPAPKNGENSMALSQSDDELVDARSLDPSGGSSPNEGPKRSIMSYDYSGYGASSGKPSELNTYYDIEAVYNCLKSEYAIKQEDVILYGQSVGSGPTLHLAARFPRLRAIVLHSAILSGIRVLFNVKYGI
ncbi:hypothetical protein ACS0TY_027717 [Phlomoides rotata]